MEYLFVFIRIAPWMQQLAATLLEMPPLEILGLWMCVFHVIFLYVMIILKYSAHEH